MTVVAMQKVRAFSASSLTPKVVSALYEFGAVHISHADQLSAGHALPSFGEISTELVKLRALEARLKLANGVSGTPAASGDLADLLVASRLIASDDLDAIESDLSKTRSKIQELANAALALEPFRQLTVSPKSLNSTLVDFAYFTLDGSFADLKKALAHLPTRALLVTPNGHAGKSNASASKSKQEAVEYVLLASDKKHAHAVLRCAARFSKKAHAIPACTHGSFSEEYASTYSQLEAARARLAELTAERADFVKENGAKIVGVRKALELQAKLADLPTKFGQSDHLVCVSAWVPKENYPAFSEHLDLRLQGAVVLETVTAGHKEATPVKLKNSAIARPFEFLVKFYSLPGTGEIDPTWAVTLGFPLFFGLIVGDIGYGLLSLLIAGFLYANSKKGEFTRTLSGLMMLTGLSTVIFGFVFAEFFGREDLLGIELHPIIHRSTPEGLSTMMALSITIALIHQAIAFLIGAYEQWTHGHKTHAYAKLAWFVFTLSFFGFIATQLDVVFLTIIAPYAKMVGGTLLGLLSLGSIIALAKFEGAAGLVEIPGLLSNVFSYLRIMALGVAGVVLAPIINQIPLDIGSVAQNPLNIIPFLIFALMFSVFHVLHLVLATVEGGIQSIRLQYVEFFGKFYKGGGIPFVPLRESAD